MKTANAFAAAGLACLALAGCQSTRTSQLPTGANAYAVIPAADLTAAPGLSRIAAGDELAVSVFQEPDLSVEKLQVDELGRIQLPLIGEMDAAGRTASELGQDIAARLGARYIRNPRVAITVTERAQRTVTVEGQVTEPGVFEIDRNATLLTALARAKSPTKVARLDEVVLFRTINGQRAGAVFDLADIRSGRAPDPQVLGGDVIVVGYSAVKGGFRDFLQAVPVLGVFTVF